MRPDSVQRVSRSTQGAGMGRRRFIALGLAGPAALAAAGCAIPGAGGDKPPASTGPVTAKVLAFSNPLFTNAQSDLVAALAEVDPQLQTDITIFPGQIGQFREKMVTIYAGGDIPDAQWIHPSITSLSGSKKLLRPLEELARRDADTQLSDFYQGVLDHFRWRGATYALSWYSPGWAFVFNKELFDRKGVTTPDRLERDGRWNWDGFVSTLRSLTGGMQGAPDRTIGSANHSMNLDWICAWLWRNGGDVFTKDVKRCVINEPASVEMVQHLQDLYLKYQVISYGPHAQDFPDGFNSGRIGLRQANKEATAPSRNDIAKATFALGMAPVYKGKAGRINRMGPLGFGVAQQAPNGDAGWRWVRFMGGPRAAGILMEAQSTLPVRAKFAQLPEFARSMHPWENKDVWLESQATARALPQPASYNDIATMWNATWGDVLAQKGTVRALLDDFARQVNAMLAQEE